MFLKQKIFNKRRRTFKAKKIQNHRKPKIDIKTDNLLIPKFQTKLGLFFYRLCVIAFFIALFYFFFLSPAFMAEEIIISGQAENETDQILNEIRPLFQGKSLNFFPKKHFLFIPSGKIKKTLLEKFKNYQSIDIERKPFGKIKFTIKQKDIVLILCGREQCAPLDKNGVATKRVLKSELPDYGTNIQIINDESNSSIEPGKGVNTQQQVDFILNLKQTAKEQANLSITELFTPLPSASEIKAKTDQAWLVFFNTEETLTKQVNALKVVLEHEISPQDKICLEYIDLRIENKAYYKLYDDCQELKKKKE
ncbi:MAG: hypothetical protein ABIC19_01365 [Patescibacteria group bacterium]|nr:hypothetical protein [Patescibacteria group bacterium]